MSLSADQRNAAERTGQDVCVVAGPGSGKTRVLIARFSWLIRDRGVPPDRILAITFTEKASTQIKMRLAAALETAPTLRQQIERAYVSTIHGFCARLLKENAIAAGVDIDFAVLDEPQSQSLLDDAADEALDGILAADRAGMLKLLTSLYVSSSSAGRNLDLAGALIRAYEAIRVAGVGIDSLRQPPDSVSGAAFSRLTSAVEDVAGMTGEWSTAKRKEKRDLLLQWLSDYRRLPDAHAVAEHFEALSQFPAKLGHLAPRAKEALTEIRDELLPAVRARLAEEWFRPSKALLLDALKRLDAAYRARKRAIASLDFSDLEEQALELLRGDPAVQKRVREQFDYILMDELQDTNRLQWRILDLIRRPGRFFGVGDINQSIYGFRHADPEVFREYRDGLESQGDVVDRLRENHRSRAGILQAVGALFAGVPGIEQHRLEAKAKFEPKPEPPVEAIVAAGSDSAEADHREALWVARRIRELAESMRLPFSSFAVLARKFSVLDRMERALRQFRIPALVIGGRTLMESREVRDALQFLRALANTRDEVSLAGVLRSPLVGIRDETLLSLKQNGWLWPSIVALGPKTATLDPADVERLLWLRDLITDLRARRDVAPDRLAARVIDESDYEGGLDAQARRNLDRFLTLLRDLHVRDGRPLAELLDELERLRTAEYLAEAPPAEAANAVRLMTIHAAKGLEFPVVFVAGLHQRAQEDRDPVAYSPRTGLGVRWRDPATQEAAEDPAYLALRRYADRRNSDEEMRLLYVAATRAKEHLVLSYARALRAHGSSWSKLAGGRLAIPDGEFTDDDSERLVDGAPVRVILSNQAVAEDLPRPFETDEPPGLAMPKPPLRDQHDSGAPVTHIAAFTGCPRRYYLRYYLGFGQSAPVDDDPDTGDDERPVSAAEIGTQVHQLLAGVAVEAPLPEAVRLVEVFRASPLARRVEAAARTEREFDFVMELQDVVIRGQIDLWFEEAGETALVDYKTDQFDPSAEPGRLAPYELQLRMYALAFQRLTGKLPDRALLYFLRANRVVDVSLDEPALEEELAAVRRFRDAQDRVAFPLLEGGHCRRCEFFLGLCPAGQATAPVSAAAPSSSGAAP
ncbi:MAG: UvrD-helicase domain-containing protein [Bryobacteraceae bacterium]|nr:UvrD-helicase domain-containing protein [Bryobacteraceae bacterium]